MFFSVVEGFYKSASLQANRLSGIKRNAFQPFQKTRGTVDLDAAVEDNSEMKPFIDQSPVESSVIQYEKSDHLEEDSLNLDSSDSLLEQLQRNAGNDIDSTPPPPPMSASVSFFLLNAVAVIWGTQHVVIKSTLDNFPAPSVLNFWRFSLSSLLFLPAFITVLVRQYLIVYIYIFIYTYMYIHTCVYKSMCI
jgi:hypothetical protein